MHEERKGVPKVDDTVLSGWQIIVDLMAEICNVPAGLIMRVNGADIEVFVASQTEGNPYNVGDREALADSGLYCEYVIRTKSPLHIVDARLDEKWCRNPDIKLNLIAYHGYPIFAPSGEVFGTICVLGRNPYDLGPLYDRLIGTFKAYIEQDLRSIAAREELEQRNAELTNAISRIESLEGILSICARCKKIRLPEKEEEDPTAWIQVETYIRNHSNAEFSHGMCPTCFQELYGDNDSL